MSIMKFEALNHNQKAKLNGYYDTVLVPVVANSGPRTSYIYDLSTFYSLYNPVDSSIGDLIGRILDSNYRVLIYRPNFVDEYSTIKIIDKDTYSYFDTEKSYRALSGDLLTVKGLASKSARWTIDSIKLRGPEIQPLLNGLNYGALAIPELSAIIRIFGGVKPPSASYNLSYLYVYDIINAFSKTREVLLNELTTILYTNLGLDYELKETGELNINFNVPHTINTNLKDFVYNDQKSAYDFIYSNGLDKPGLRLKSKSPDSDSDIKISFTQQSDFEYILNASRLKSGDAIYSESIYINLLEGSRYGLSSLTDRSKLIEYLDGDLTSDMIGTYNLGYPSPKAYDIYSCENKFQLQWPDSILFVINPIIWKEETANQDRIRSYLVKLSEFSKGLSSVALTCEPYIEGVNELPNLIIVTPNVKNNYNTISVELLLANLLNNRLESDVDFNGRLDGSAYTIGRNVITIEYSQYKFTLNQPEILFQNKWISLKMYIGWISASRYIGEYLEYNQIAKLSEIDLDGLRTSLLSRYFNLISSVQFDKQRIGRKYQLSVSLEFESQVTQKILLIVNLVEE